ncbi:MAG: phosphoribosylformylglycinamidine synthase [Candidatus Amulumruptor caecigallinarius]|nr:phosphoribosylformylglycinamidine synthase [Candidatus Amulumruptor caecigallinarius]
MSAHRVFVEKRPEFRVEAESLRKELNTTLGLDIKDLRLICVYDLFGFSEELLAKTRYGVFGETATDTVTDTLETDNAPHLAVESLPGQYDQRAAAARECVRLVSPEADVEILSARMYIFDKGVTPEQLKKIASYLINSVESREKDLSKLELPGHAHALPVKTLNGFREITASEADAYCHSMGLAMNADDLMEVVKYFTAEGRDPNETELRILDTYWSDHCRHTTFTSLLTDIEVKDSFIAEDIRESLNLWHKMRSDLGRSNKPLCLMDLATIGARWLRANGKLEDLEQSEENNACSIYVDVDVDGANEKWLLQFKNETHNHPTEIEPFGGASTCLGGAIRDPLSGRSYVYQAMRVTGAGDIYRNVADTLPGKLPQRVISKVAAHGYSSYGNQIGLATTHVREIYHPGYVAKRLEVGAVVGAVRAGDVRRERPAAGDVVLMFGGRTGRDGIGGATGSSKEHNESSLEMCGSEVQKGNAPEERKLARLFRRPEVTRLIKKSNDFGAGGVSVAIGELTDGLDIYLDRVTTKYAGLNATELAISESQERMSVVVEASDMDEFMKYCHEENIEVRHVADVTDSGRMRIYYKGETVADLSREFIDSAGAPHFAKAVVAPVEQHHPFEREVEGETFKDKLLNNLLDPNVTSQRGLIEMFDSTIGASTVLMPFGGLHNGTETQVSVQKLPTGTHHTNTASMMSWGFDPFICSRSPYHGAAYAVVSAVAKAVAAGADFHKMRFSYQEYFERMHSPESWGKPLSALLGALRMQKEFGLPSIGGKDSMSGTFGNINVPPTMIAFGVATVDARDVISPELKGVNHGLYLLRHRPLKSGMPNSAALQASYDAIYGNIKNKRIPSAYAIGRGGLAEALVKMSLGNHIGVDTSVDENDIFEPAYGSIVFEAIEPIEIPGVEFIGYTIAEPKVKINHTEISIEDLAKKTGEKFNEIYPDTADTAGEAPDASCNIRPTAYSGTPVEHPKVLLPVFPGTNCDYDMQSAFAAEGAEVTTCVFRNLTAEDISASCSELASGIDNSHILAISGGFSAADEPDGSGKFIATVLLNAEVRAAVGRLMARGGLILGICNGFQALVKSGLLPFGKIGELTPDSPTLFRNDINRHISQIAVTRVGTTASPWLDGFTIGELHSIAMSHGEGKFVADEKLLNTLLTNGQIAFQYADPLTGHATMQSPMNPNGSSWAIEGIISPDGHILGKMGHSERYREGLMKNVAGNKEQNIFRNAVNYFRNK